LLVAVEIGHPEFAYIVRLDGDRLGDLGAVVGELPVQALSKETDAARRPARALGQMQARLAKPQPSIIRRLGPGELDGEAEDIAIVGDDGVDVADAEHRGKAVDLSRSVFAHDEPDTRQFAVYGIAAGGNDSKNDPREDSL